MGAAEWTGYTNSTPTYSSYSSLPSSVAPAPPPSSSSAYGYDTNNMAEHHSNFHIPTVIADMQPFSSTDYHSTNHLTSAINSTTLVPSTPSSELDALNPGYTPTYNNWSSNGYSNYQYGGCPPSSASSQQSQVQYSATGATGATMLIYPQVYSMVNQNQIHLHLHGTDKIEQYLTSSENTFGSNVTRNAILGNTDSANNVISDDTNQHHQQSQQTSHNQSGELNPTSNRDDEQEVGDPSSVWRPY